MAERAHPDLQGFKSPWVFRLRRGFIPWLTYEKRPYRSELLKRYKWANRFCKRKKVLDVPCGMGWGTSLLKSASERVGVDLSASAISEARTRFGERINFTAASMAKLPFKEGEFEAIVCLEGIEHVPTDIGRAFIAECWRVLEPGGELLLSSPYCADGNHSGNPFHVHEYQPSEIAELLSDWFEISDTHESQVENLSIRYIRAARRQLPPAST